MNRKQFIQGVGLGTFAIVTGSSRGNPETGPRDRSADTGIMPRGVDFVPTTPFDAPDGTWTLAVLPDTQHYAAYYPDVFVRQGEWLAKHGRTHDIRFVVHEGDVTDNNKPNQWLTAKNAMDLVADAGIPYLLITGNHDLDQPTGRPEDRSSSRINKYFGKNDYRNSIDWGWYAEGHIENSWHEIGTPNGKVLFVGLEFGPTDQVLAWAKGITAERKPDLVVVVVHAYLNADGTRYDYFGTPAQRNASPTAYPMPGINDGEAIWKKWLLHEPAAKIVVSGHAAGRGAAYLASRNAAGTLCHQILANYQMPIKPDKGFGGGGFLRLMQFLPDRRTVRIKTYSPWYNLWLREPEQHFEIDLAG